MAAQAGVNPVALQAGMLAIQATGAVKAVKAKGLKVPHATARMTPSNLQKNFDKHAADFGLTGNWNKAQGEVMRQAIEQHLAKPSNISIIGAYRRKPGVVHVLDQQTGLNVVIGGDGYFMAGWKLSPSQVQDVLTTGHLW